MDFNNREQKMFDAVMRFDEKDTTKRILFALFKYSAFAAIVLLVFNVMFGNLFAAERFAFALTIVTLMVYELKGREIILYRVIKKLQNKINESAKR